MKYEFKNTYPSANMTFGQLKKYLGEWYDSSKFGTQIKVGEYESGKVYHFLVDTSTGERIFYEFLELGADLNDNTVVSTTNILNDELRGIIEQSYSLDKQLAESLAEIQTPSQKGEE